MKHERDHPTSYNHSRRKVQREFLRSLRWLSHYDPATVAAPPFALRAYNAWARSLWR